MRGSEIIKTKRVADERELCKIMYETEDSV